MITVNARPRTSSGAPRWTSSELHSTAPPFPMPPSAHHAGAVHERQDAEDRRPRDVGDDHRAAPRESVEQRREEEPDEDCREPLRKQERTDPGTRLRAVLDVDDERD